MSESMIHTIYGYYTYHHISYSILAVYIFLNRYSRVTTVNSTQSNPITIDLVEFDSLRFL